MSAPLAGAASAPNGTLGNLDPHQEQALKDFHTQFDRSLDDLEALRFLRARKFSAKAAVKQAQEAYELSDEVGRPTILDNKPDGWDEYRRHFPVEHLGFDKEHHPVSVLRLGSANYSFLAKRFTKDEWKAIHCCMIEEQFSHFEEASRRAGRPMEEMKWIVDLHGLSAEAWKGIPLAKLQFTIDGLMYPERNGGSFIIRAPWIFPVLFRAVRPFIDAHTRDKIEVHGAAFTERLLEVMDADILPRELGGTSDRKLPVAYREPSGGAEAAADEPDGVEEVKVAAGKELVSEVRARNAHCVITWWFSVLGSHDLEFFVRFKPTESIDEAPVDTADAEGWQIVESPARIPGGSVVQGTYGPPGPGLVQVVWSNKHSWMRPKALRHVVETAELARDREMSVLEREVSDADAGAASAKSS